MRKKKLVIILVSAFVFLMLIGGSSYAYFVYNKDIGNVSLETGDISLGFSNSNNVTLTNLIPMTDSMGKVNGTYIDFTVSGTVDTDRIYYEVYLVPKDNSTMTSDNIDNYVKTYLTDQSDVKINDVKLYKYLRDSTKGSGKIIYQAIIEPNTNGTTKSENKDFRLRLWLSDDYPNNSSEVFNFNLYLHAINVDENFEIEPYADGKVRKAINVKINAEANACNPIWIDDMGTTSDTSDDITYFSGTNDCIDMNYVWYSGKLWRIIAIYPDGAMKLITDDGITNVVWGNNSEFNNSWVYQWLNEDFYSTLSNAKNIVKLDGVWNYSLDSNSIPIRPEDIATQKSVSAPVGLLSHYEYYNGHRNSETSNNYLSNGTYWYLLTAKSSTIVYNVRAAGTINSISASARAYAIRPSIYIKAELDFSGNGTSSDPYLINGATDVPINNTTLLSSRFSGEYVKFDNEIYRIVETDLINGTTKLVKNTNIQIDSSDAKKNIASSIIYGKSTNTQSDDYWDYYLNNTWYNGLSSTYKNMLVDSTYYLGSLAKNNYKKTICSDELLNNVTVKNCTKYTALDEDKTFVGKVGILRMGEMFSCHKDGSVDNSWTITPYNDTYVHNISTEGNATLFSSSVGVTNFYVARPTIVLKSGIKITGGTGYVGGDTDSPFEISE